VRIGDVLRLEVERPVSGGMFLARVEGQVVLLPYVDAGESVEAEIVRVRADMLEAAPRRVIDVSPARVDPPCPYYGDCGGCFYQHITYERETEHKRAVAEDCLRRIGKIEGAEIRVHPSPIVYGYRNSCRFHVWGKKIGFYRGRSNWVIHMTNCPLLEGPLNEELRRLAGELPFTKGQIAARCGEEGISSGLDRREVHIAVPPWRFRTSPLCFFQVNRFLLGEWLSTLGEMARDAGARRVLDLFCGVGTISIALASVAEEVLGIENNRLAVEVARKNAEENGVANATFALGDAGEVRETMSGRDLIVVDPPRTGLPPEAIDDLGASGAKAILYSSCGPPTFARDVARLLERGYHPRRFELFDFFPRTPHMEIVTLLVREKG
jgi:23S rRNA (uracil1939-C5)-methyltransferase